MRVFGTVHYFYMYDVGGDIDLTGLKKALATMPEQVELKYTTLMPRYVKLDPAPVQIEFKKKKIGARAYDCAVRIYALGAMSICFKKQFACEFRELLKPLDEKALRREADAVAARLLKQLGPCITHEYEHAVEPEDYKIFVIKKTAKAIMGKSFLEAHRGEIAALLREEDTGVLSSEEAGRACRQPIFYYTNDLAVVGYANALLLSPHEEADLILSLELANIQLLELRTYSTLLDKLLTAAYNSLRTGAVKSLFGEKQAASARRLAEMRLDLTELVGNVLNMTRFVGDWLTARVYAAASERLHLAERREEVVRKLEVLEDFYTVALERTTARRELLLTTAIVLLIILEISLAVLKIA